MKHRHYRRPLPLFIEELFEQMYKPAPITKVKKKMLADFDNWQIPFFDFVDDFRYCKDLSILLSKPFETDSPLVDALLASTVEYLCDELHMEPPQWILDVPALKEPWFVGGGGEKLQALAVIECPVFFRKRLIFVLDNFI